MDSSNSQFWRRIFELMTRGHTRLELTPEQWEMLITNVIAQLKKRFRYLFKERITDQLFIYEQWLIRPMMLYFRDADTPNQLLEKGLLLATISSKKSTERVAVKNTNVPRTVLHERLFLDIKGNLIQVTTNHSIKVYDQPDENGDELEERIASCEVTYPWLKQMFEENPRLGAEIIKSILDVYEADIKPFEDRLEKKKADRDMLLRIHGCVNH